MSCRPADRQTDAVPPDQGPITAVWIDYGCIACGACEKAAPSVFAVTAWSAQIRGTVRKDGLTDENPGHVGLKADRIEPCASGIVAAAAACPVAVIVFSRASPSSGPGSSGHRH